MNNIYYELAQTQLALDAAQKVIRRQRGKLFGKNLLLVGTIGLFWTACKMLDESEKKRKAEKERADAAEPLLITLTVLMNSLRTGIDSTLTRVITRLDC